MLDRKTPFLVADIIIEKQGKILLVTRGHEPFKGKLAFPGGFVEYNETVENAAIREAKEETGLNINLRAILGVYSDPKRDPRGHSITTVFVADVFGGEIKAGDDAEEARLYSLAELDLGLLGFDHARILRDFLKWKRKGETYWSSKQGF